MLQDSQETTHGQHLQLTWYVNFNRIQSKSMQLSLPVFPTINFIASYKNLYI